MNRKKKKTKTSFSSFLEEGGFFFSSCSCSFFLVRCSIGMRWYGENERGVLDEGGTHRGAGHVDTGWAARPRKLCPALLSLRLSLALSVSMTNGPAFGSCWAPVCWTWATFFLLLPSFTPSTYIGSHRPWFTRWMRPFLSLASPPYSPIFFVEFSFLFKKKKRFLFFFPFFFKK